MSEKDKEFVLSIIPARGGSKGIPHKNKKDLCGLPLIAYSIIEASRSKYINRIVVSTDDNEIAAIAKEYGAEVPFIRPSWLADDYVKDLPVILHALEFLEKSENYKPEIIVLLRPTSPLRKATQIDEAISLLLKNEDADSVRSVTPAKQHPLKTWRIEKDQLMSFVPEDVYGISEAYNYPRQKLPQAYIQNGAIDVIRRKTTFEKRSLTGTFILPYIMDEISSINIDSPIDLMTAKAIMKNKAAIT